MGLFRYLMGGEARRSLKKLSAMADVDNISKK